MSRAEGAAFAKKHGCLFVETSAKANVAVGQAFEELVMKVCPALLECMHALTLSERWLRAALGLSIRPCVMSACWTPQDVVAQACRGNLQCAAYAACALLQLALMAAGVCLQVLDTPSLLNASNSSRLNVGGSQAGASSSCCS